MTQEQAEFAERVMYLTEQGNGYLNCTHDEKLACDAVRGNWRVNGGTWAHSRASWLADYVEQCERENGRKLNVATLRAGAGERDQ